MNFIREQLVKIKKIREYHGDTGQKKKIIEELQELIVEIQKELDTNSDNRTCIIEESADVYIMLEQLQMIKDINIMELHDVANFKLNRTLEIIDKNVKGNVMVSY